MNRSHKQQLKVRLPADLKVWLAAESGRNGASQNSEVVRALRERMERQTQPETSPPAG